MKIDISAKRILKLLMERQNLSKQDCLDKFFMGSEALLNDLLESVRSKEFKSLEDFITFLLLDVRYKSMQEILNDYPELAYHDKNGNIDEDLSFEALVESGRVYCVTHINDKEVIAYNPL